MADLRLRELERNYQESGSLEAQLAWLGARQRSGESIETLLPDFEQAYQKDPTQDVPKDYLKSHVEGGRFAQADDDLFHLMWGVQKAIGDYGKESTVTSFDPNGEIQRIQVSGEDLEQINQDFNMGIGNLLSYFPSRVEAEFGVEYLSDNSTSTLTYRGKKVTVEFMGTGNPNYGGIFELNNYLEERQPQEIIRSHFFSQLNSSELDIIPYKIENERFILDLKEIEGINYLKSIMGNLKMGALEKPIESSLILNKKIILERFIPYLSEYPKENDLSKLNELTPEQRQEMAQRIAEVLGITSQE